MGPRVDDRCECLSATRNRSNVTLSGGAPGGTSGVTVTGLALTPVVAGVRTSKWTVAAAVLTVLVAESWTSKLPLPSGVPEMTPVELSISRPGGSPVAPKRYAPFVATTAYENAMPAFPPADDGLVIVVITLGSTTRGQAKCFWGRV